MIDSEQQADAPEGDYVVFLHAGESAKGSYRCTDCGYGVVVTAGLPVCPMCGCANWEQAEWSPFGRSGSLL